MARRDPVGIRLITRKGNDWTTRYPLVVEAMNHLKVRSCLIDGEVVCCDERGLAIFSTLRRRRNEARAFLFAFDLLELDGLDMRREPIETRKATLASLLRKGKPGVRLNEHIAHPNGAAVFHHACKLGAEGIVSKRLGSRYNNLQPPRPRIVSLSGQLTVTLIAGGRFVGLLPDSVARYKPGELGSRYCLSNCPRCGLPSASSPSRIAPSALWPSCSSDVRGKSHTR